MGGTCRKVGKVTVGKRKCRNLEFDTVNTGLGSATGNHTWKNTRRRHRWSVGCCLRRNVSPTQARVFGGVAGGIDGIAGGATSAIVNAGFN